MQWYCTKPFINRAPGDFYPTVPEFWRPVRRGKWIPGASHFLFLAPGLGELKFPVSENSTCLALNAHQSDKKITWYELNVDWMNPNKSFYDENPNWNCPEIIAARLYERPLTYLLLLAPPLGLGRLASWRAERRSRVGEQHCHSV